MPTKDSSEFLASLRTAVSNKDIQQVNAIMAQAADGTIPALGSYGLFELFGENYDKDMLYTILDRYPEKNRHFQILSLFIMSLNFDFPTTEIYQQYIKDLIHYIPKDQLILQFNNWSFFRSQPPPSKLKRIIYDEIGYPDISTDEFKKVFELTLAAATKLGIEPIDDTKQKGLMFGQAKPHKHIPDFPRNGLPGLRTLNIAVLNETVNEFADYLKDHSLSEMADFSIVKKSISSLVEPTFIPWGMGEHAIGLVKYKDYLIVSDRRAGRHIHDNTYIGTTIYKLKSWPGAIMQDELTVDEFNKHLQEIVEPVPIAEFIETAQKRGTCSFTNYKAVMKGLLVLDIQLKRNEEHGLTLNSISEDVYEKATQLYKKYTSHYRDREIEKLITMYKDPKISRLAYEQVFSALYDYITGHTFLNQTKDIERISKILNETDICSADAEKLLKYEVDILLLSEVCQYVKNENAFSEVRNHFLAFSLEDKLNIIKNSDNILIDNLNQLTDLARSDPTFINTLKETPWFILKAYEALQEAMINQNEKSFNDIVDFLQSLDGNQTLTLVNHAKDESLFDLSVILKQPSFTERLQGASASIKDKSPTLLSVAECQQHLNTITTANTYFEDANLIRRYLRIAMNSLDSPNEKLDFLAADNFSVFKYILKFHQELITFFANEVDHCGATASQKQLVFENAGIIDFLNDGYCKLAVTFKGMMTSPSPEEASLKPRKGLFWTSKENVTNSPLSNDDEYYSCDEEFEEVSEEEKRTSVKPVN